MNLHRYWAPTAFVAGVALFGCGGDDNTSNPVGASPTTGGTPATGATAPTAGTPSTTGTGATGATGTGTAATSGGSKAGSGATTTTPPSTAGGSAATPTAGATATPATGGSAAPNTSPTAGMGAMATAGTGAPATAGGGAMPPAMTGAGTCGPATMNAPSELGDPMKKGPWMPMMKAGSGPSGSSTLFYPADLGKDGVKHPVFHWGCGAGSQPSQYADHLNLLASHGIVVIANASGSNPSKASLDWILAENEKMGSMFFGKLDPERVAIGGHSLGALETMGAAKDPRIKTYILVCGGCMSGRGGCGAADIHAPSIFLGGEGEGGTNNFKGDYAEIKTSPSVFVTKTMTDHIACARNNLGPWVAFMRWNLCGEESQWKKEFMSGGTYCKSPWLDCMSKNL